MNGDQPAGIAPVEVLSLGTTLLQQGIVIPSFAQFAVTGDDNLLITCVGSLAGLTLNINGRFLDATKGGVVPFGVTMPVPSNRTVGTTLFSLGLGYLLNLGMFTTGSPGPSIGQVFATAQMVRGLAGATFNLGALVSGYCTNTQTLAWPGAPVRSSTDGEPPARNLQGTHPGLHSECSDSVPTGARWELLAWSVVLTTGTTVQNRTFTFQIQDVSQNVFWETQATVLQPASNVWRYVLGAAVSPYSGVSGTEFFLPLPAGLKLTAGFKLLTNASNLIDGDNYTAPNITVREWLEVV